MANILQMTFYTTFGFVEKKYTHFDRSALKFILKSPIDNKSVLQSKTRTSLTTYRDIWV